MDNFEISAQSVINELLAENRRLVLEVSTLRAAITETRLRAEGLSAAANGNSIQSTNKEQ